MSLRAEDAGWVEVLAPRADARRKLWMRRTTGDGRHVEGRPIRDPGGEIVGVYEPNVPVATVELCAGREGDDAYVAMRVGDVITIETLHNIVDVVQCVRYAFDTEEPGAEADEEAEEKSAHERWADHVHGCPQCGNAEVHELAEKSCQRGRELLSALRTQR